MNLRKNLDTTKWPVPVATSKKDSSLLYADIL